MSKREKALAILLILFSTMLACGCATGVMGETVVGQPGSAMWEITASTQTKMNHYMEECASYGIVAGTRQMNQCVEIKADGRSNRANTMQAIGGANSTY